MVANGVEVGESIELDGSARICVCTLVPIFNSSWNWEAIETVLSKCSRLTETPSVKARVWASRIVLLICRPFNFCEQKKERENKKMFFCFVFAKTRQKKKLTADFHNYNLSKEKKKKTFSDQREKSILLKDCLEHLQCFGLSDQRYLFQTSRDHNYNTIKI